ncbi:protein OSB2, chloroplastic-like [Salvia splendens]|uniref:protein OSB2, chloroplastic-like n=1 Tax=Salvia splendens TaxID=180675 RepID=UPI0011052777|nr:protein OSB2, chloroplastic-like [Salvia splendens]
MALKQTLIPNNTLLLHRDPIRISPFSSRFLNPNAARKLAPAPLIKCSYDYGAASSNSWLYEYERFAAPGPQYPRPPEIQWKKELCNSVQLIGVVGAPVQIKHLASGKAVAWTRLAVKKSQTDTTWISLTFWDDLAHIASQHVEKGQQIHVSGRLVSDTVETDDGKQQVYYKVVVQQLNFIERSPPPVPLYNGDSNSATPGKSQSAFSANSTGTTEELWQAYFANPMEWWDNRKNKRSPNYPDFKHKDTGEALWVEGRYNPPWVKSQLSVLDSKMESFNEQSSSTNVSFMNADSLGSF